MISTVEIAVAPPKDTPRTDNNGRDLRNGYNLGRLNHDNIIPRETVRMTQRSTARTCARKDQSRDKTGERDKEREKKNRESNSLRQTATSEVRGNSSIVYLS